MKQLNYRLKPGFGPLEAVLVLSAILLLVSAGFTYYSIFQAQQRDQTRIANLKIIQSAVNSYFNKYREFPAGDKDLGNWDLGYRNSNDHRFIHQLVEKGFLPANFAADPISKYDENKGIDYTFRYQVYPDDGQFCPRGQGPFYVLGIRDLESVSDTNDQPGKFDGSGFMCKNRNWQDEFDYVVGEFAFPVKNKK